MSCRKFQFLIATEDPADLAHNVTLQAHLASCADCAQLHEEMKALSAATGSLAQLQAPRGFEGGVSVRLRQVKQVKATSWLDRIVGPLRAPAPVLQPRHAFAGAAVLIVAIVLVAALLHPLGPAAINPNLPGPGFVGPAGGQPVSYPLPTPAQPSAQPGVPPRNAP